MQNALVVLLILLVSTQQPAPPAQGPPGIPDALRIQAKDPAGAAKILEGVTEREPQNARAWRLLGVALQQSKQFDRAIEAYQKSLAIGKTIRRRLQRRHRLRAEERTGPRVRVAGESQGDAQIRHDADTGRHRPRAAAQGSALHRTAADQGRLRQPVRRERKILGEWHGEAINDQFGWVARDIGDRRQGRRS